MKGDFSRLTFEPGDHYAGVLHQQGRVWLDADWNEDVLARLHLLRQATRDVVGPCGTPFPGTAFGLEPPAPGRQPDDFGIRGGQGPAGHFYVDGILCQLEHDTSYLRQPDLPDAPRVTMPGPGQSVTALVYLEVWQQLVTYLEDDTLREVALGGPDTATRLRIVAQVRVQPLPAGVSALTCAAASQFLPGAGQGTLTTLAPQDLQPPDPCRIPDPDTYTGRENHLYRVEIHDGGGVAGPAPGSARFKWSRDNAAFAVRVTGVAGDRRTLTLAAIGRDQATALRQGDLVEVADDASELGPARGHLTNLSTDPDDDLVVRLADPLPASFRVDLREERHLLLRRWDGQGRAAGAFDPATTPDMDLGNGVHIQFGGSNLQPGDHWLFTARAADGSVERLTAAAPTGITRHRCPLAVVRWTQQAGSPLSPPGSPPGSPPTSPPGSGPVSFTVLADCRPVFPAVTELTSFFYVSGDGQEATPDPNDLNRFLPLDQPLCAGVANGRYPVRGATVRFEIPPGRPGRLENGGARMDVTTGPDGLARCGWELDSRTQSQQVQARLLDRDGNPVHLPVLFSASLSVASEVAYDPAACRDLQGVSTVQQAIDHLCQRGPGGGCEVTVGDGGQFPRLVEAVLALRDAGLSTWCMCLLPGDHKLAGLDLSGSPPHLLPHVSISACGPGSRLLLRGGPLHGQDLASFRLTGVSIDAADPAAALDLHACRLVALRDLRISAAGKGQDDVLSFQGCEEVSLRDVSVRAGNVASLLVAAQSRVLAMQACELLGTGTVGLVATIAASGEERIHLDGNALSAPLVPRSASPATIFVDLPELRQALDLADDEEFAKAARQEAGALAQRPLPERRALADRLADLVTANDANLRADERQRYQQFIQLLAQQVAVAGQLVAALTGLRRAVLGGPGLALVIAGAADDVTVEANVVAGVVSLYGPPGPSRVDTLSDLQKLADLLRAGQLKLTATAGVFQGRGNRLTRLSVAEAVIRQLQKIIQGQGGELAGLYRSLLLTDNVVEAGGNWFVAGRSSLASTFLQTGAPAVGRAGVLLGDAATFTANHGPGQEAELIDISLAHAEAANLIKITHL
jgi:Family of unknown function (DUF6519)